MQNWQRPSFSAIKSILNYGVFAFLADLPTILFGPMLSYLFILVASSAGDYGTFDLAFRIATLAATALAMLSTPFFAMVAASHVDELKTKMRRMLNKYLRLTLLLGLCGWMIFLLFGLQLLEMLFPDRPADIYQATLIMLGGSAMVAALEPISRMLMGLGKLRQLAIGKFAMLIAGLITAVLLSNQGPLQRYSIACAVGYLATAFGLVWFYRREEWGREARTHIP
jgi:O-antigen/teichoic acid export membrane protein